MLIMVRKIGESILIGEDIKLKVLSIRGNSVRIGIDASTELPVWREELYKKLQEKAKNQIKKQKKVKK